MDLDRPTELIRQAVASAATTGGGPVISAWLSWAGLAIAFAWVLIVSLGLHAWPILFQVTALVAMKLILVNFEYSGDLRQPLYEFRSANPLPHDANAEEVLSHAIVVFDIRLQIWSLIERNVLLLVFVAALLAMQLQSVVNFLSIGLAGCLALATAVVLMRMQGAAMVAGTAYRQSLARVSDDDLPPRFHFLPTVVWCWHTGLIVCGAGLLAFFIYMIVATFVRAWT